MKFSIWHLLALTTYAGIYVAVLSKEMTEFTTFATMFLTVLYATIAVSLIVYGKEAVRAWAIGAIVPLSFLFIGQSFMLIFIVTEGPGFSREGHYQILVATCWMLPLLCGPIAATIRSYNLKKNLSLLKTPPTTEQRNPGKP